VYGVYEEIMPRHKSVPRVRATPRQIRDIKPKRQLTRGQIDPSDEWWRDAEEADNTGSGADTSNGHSRGASENSNGASVEDNYDGNTHGGLKQCRINCTEWYQRTSRIKKLKQFFWTYILYRTLKLIYVVDLENYSLSKWQSASMYDGSSSVKVKSMSDSFFSADDLEEAARYSPRKLSSLGAYGSNIMGGSSNQNQPDLMLGQYSSNINSLSKAMDFDRDIISSGVSKNGAFGGAKNVVQSIFAPSKTKLKAQVSGAITNDLSHNNFHA
jgi:hypothetical protein